MSSHPTVDVWGGDGLASHITCLTFLKRDLSLVVYYPCLSSLLGLLFSWTHPKLQKAKKKKIFSLGPYPLHHTLQTPKFHSYPILHFGNHLPNHTNSIGDQLLEYKFPSRALKLGIKCRYLHNLMGCKPKRKRKRKSIQKKGVKVNLRDVNLYNNMSWGD